LASRAESPMRSAPVAAASEPVPATAPAEPTRKVASDFDWPDENVTAGTTTFLPSGLDGPPPTAN
jgi:hypothetical protein